MKEEKVIKTTDIIFIVGIAIGIIIGMMIKQLEFKQEKVRMDVNRDGEVSAADYVTIKNYIMNRKE